MVWTESSKRNNYAAFSLGTVTVNTEQIDNSVENIQTVLHCLSKNIKGENKRLVVESCGTHCTG